MITEDLLTSNKDGYFLTIADASARLTFIDMEKLLRAFRHDFTELEIMNAVKFGLFTFPTPTFCSRSSVSGVENTYFSALNKYLRLYMYHCNTHNCNISNFKEYRNHLRFFHHEEAHRCPICQNYCSENLQNFTRHFRKHSDIEIHRLFSSNIDSDNDITIEEHPNSREGQTSPADISMPDLNEVAPQSTNEISGQRHIDEFISNIKDFRLKNGKKKLTDCNTIKIFNLVNITYF